jgi:hypothetical protein
MWGGHSCPPPLILLLVLVCWGLAQPRIPLAPARKRVPHSFAYFAKGGIPQPPRVVALVLLVSSAVKGLGQPPPDSEWLQETL